MDGSRTASAVTAEPNTGVIVFTALCTAVSRLACLSGTETFCALFPTPHLPPPSPCCSGVSSHEERPFFSILSQGTSVACKRLPGVSVYSQCLEVMLADVLEARTGVSQSASFQLPILHREGPLRYDRPPHGRHDPASENASA